MTRMTAPARRYLLRVTIAMAIYVVSLVAANRLIEAEAVSGPLVWLLALTPGLAAAGLFYAVGMFIVEQKDEFIRMLLVRQNLIATGFALSIATVWGFLEEFQLVGHVEAFYIIVLWSIGLAVGAASNRLTHGTWGSCW